MFAYPGLAPWAAICRRFAACGCRLPSARGAPSPVTPSSRFQHLWWPHQALRACSRNPGSPAAPIDRADEFTPNDTLAINDVGFRDLKRSIEPAALLLRIPDG